MYQINDKIIYKRDICIIKEIKKNFYKETDYYCISPIIDPTLTINIPVDTPLIKDILTKKEALTIIESIPKVELIDSDDKLLENLYKELLSTDDELDLVKIIKTTYLRNKKRIDTGKKIRDKDDTYFKKAENYLYTSLSISLNMSYDECKNYIIDKLEKEGI